MSLEIVQAAKLGADYINKRFYLGIDVCQDERLCQFVIKDSLAICDITIDCTIKPVELTTFNSTKTCTATTISDQNILVTQSTTAPSTNDTPLKASPIIDALCTYTTTTAQLFPIRYELTNGQVVTQDISKNLSIAADRTYLENKISNILEYPHGNSTVTITGTYTFTLVGYAGLKSIVVADDFAGTNATEYIFNKDCTQ